MINSDSLYNFINFLLTKAIVKWFFTVSMGLLIDLTIFYLLSSQGSPIFLCNIISSGLAITFVYFSSVRFVFKDKEYKYLRYTLFIGYYSLSISFFSYLISVLVYEFSFIPLLAKIITLPFSFIINYYFASKIV